MRWCWYWVLGPALMFTLAWLFLPDLPEYRTGMIIVGLARCIAMVIIWNDLACGDREAAAVLVAINSVIQVVIFAVLGWFYLSVLPGWLGLAQASIATSPWQIAKSVLIFLGIPLLAGYLSRRYGEKARGRQWYETTFLPKIGPWALYGLLFTIVILFALQGDQITDRPWTWCVSRFRCWPTSRSCGPAASLSGAALGLGYPRTTTLAFTAAGNNFELAIAVAIATYGATSGQALAGVVGPLIEVPVLVGLVYVSLALRHRFRLRPRTKAVMHGFSSERVVRLHPQCRPVPDGGGLPARPGRRMPSRSAPRAAIPGHAINPAAVEAMAEVGIDISDQSPKLLTHEAVETSDVVITMGCGDACPVFPGISYRDWALRGPGRQGHRRGAPDPRRDQDPRGGPGRRTAARSAGRPRERRPTVLFVCVKNGGKSQMAAGLMRKIAGDRIEVYSAGTHPGAAAQCAVGAVAAGVGVDITGEHPKPIDAAAAARGRCRRHAGAGGPRRPLAGPRFENWDTDEPSERGIDGIERMRLIRDDIATRVQRARH